MVQWCHTKHPGWYQRKPYIGSHGRTCSYCGAETQPAIEVKMEHKGRWVQQPEFHNYYFCLEGESCQFRKAVQ